MIASLYNGWLWIEVFLKPLDKLLRMGLFLGVLYVFARLIEHSSSFPLWHGVSLCLTMLF